jgi:hypothetical protein
MQVVQIAVGESPRSYFFYFYSFPKGGFFRVGLWLLFRFGFGLVWEFVWGALGRVALSHSTLYYTFHPPRPAMQLRLRPRPLIDLPKNPTKGDMITYTAKTSSQTEPPQRSSLTSHIDLSSPGSPERTSGRYMVWGRDGSGLLFYAIFIKRKGEKSRSSKGTGREGLPQTKYFSGNRLCLVSRVGL